MNAYEQRIRRALTGTTSSGPSKYDYEEALGHLAAAVLDTDRGLLSMTELVETAKAAQ